MFFRNDTCVVFFRRPRAQVRLTFALKIWKSPGCVQNLWVATSFLQEKNKSKTSGFPLGTYNWERKDWLKGAVCIRTENLSDISHSLRINKIRKVKPTIQINIIKLFFHIKYLKKYNAKSCLSPVWFVFVCLLTLSVIVGKHHCTKTDSDSFVSTF